jgi:tol-pal system protein YbgF
MQMRNLFLASFAGLIAIGAPVAWAQKVPDLPQPALPLADPSEVIPNKNIEKRLQREEKALRELRQIVLQAKSQGNPVVVKDAGPDPQVVELQGQVNDLTETLRRQTGQMETLGHDAALAAKSAADAHDALKALAARLDAVEKQLLAAQSPGGPPAPGAAVNAGSGVLGTLVEPAPGAPAADQAAGPGPGPGDEPAAYRAARQTLDSGDYVGGAAALQDYLQRYPTSSRAPEANYWLGRTLALRNMPADAAAAYARALKGWPQSAWAGDAVVRLSTALIDLKRGPDACRALEEYSTRYARKASSAVQIRAKDARAAAACG